jgi:hypothetical protein
MPKAKTQNKLFALNSMYGQGVIDNGAKWGSYVTRNEDGTIPFDERLYLENPTRWQAMMDERMKWLTTETGSACTNSNSINGCPPKK